MRIQPVCRVTGEAAGVAAAMCIDNNIFPHQLNGVELKKETYRVRSMSLKCKVFRLHDLLNNYIFSLNTTVSINIYGIYF